MNLKDLIKKIKAMYEEPEKPVSFVQIRYMSPSGRLVRAVVRSDGKRIR